MGASEGVRYKPRWGAFFGTPLERHLLGLGVTTVVVCGCNYPNCPRSTIYEASERHFKAVFVADATSGTYRRAMREFDAIGVRVMGTDSCLEWLEEGGHGELAERGVEPIGIG